MHYPASTGQVARLLGVPEPRLNDLIRRERINPPPAVLAGRRLWQEDDVIRALEALGRPGVLTAQGNEDRACDD